MATATNGLARLDTVDNVGALVELVTTHELTTEGYVPWQCQETIPWFQSGIITEIDRTAYDTHRFGAIYQDGTLFASVLPDDAVLTIFWHQHVDGSEMYLARQLTAEETTRFYELSRISQNDKETLGQHIWDHGFAYAAEVSESDEEVGMDPRACLHELLEAMDAGDSTATYDLAATLKLWLDHGGASPVKGEADQAELYRFLQLLIEEA